MKRVCAKCGHEYSVGAFRYDSGRCPACGEELLGLPAWFGGTPEATKALWEFLMILHVVFLIPFLLVLDPVGYLAGFYSATVLVYLGVRTSIARRRGYPALSKLQAVMIALLPVWGTVLFVTLAMAANWLRWGM